MGLASRRKKLRRSAWPLEVRDQDRGPKAGRPRPCPDGMLNYLGDVLAIEDKSFVSRSQRHGSEHVHTAIDDGKVARGPQAKGNLKEAIDHKAVSSSFSRRQSHLAWQQPSHARVQNGWEVMRID